jgi:hypothetical protein
VNLSSRLVVVLLVLVLGACGDDADTDATSGRGGEGATSGDATDVDDPVDSADGTSAREDADGVVECSSLEGPIDAEVVARFTDPTADGFVSGCWIDGSDLVQLAGSLQCDDGRTLLVVGDRAGVEGSEWGPWDMDSGENVNDALC